jgi:hypothetical protein
LHLIQFGKVQLSQNICQFWRAMTTFAPDTVWKGSTESKCRFFGWLVMHLREIGVVTHFVLYATAFQRQHLTCYLNVILLKLHGT